MIILISELSTEAWRSKELSVSDWQVGVSHLSKVLLL